MVFVSNKKFIIEFTDKRRSQRGMLAKDSKEVEEYISKKYNLIISKDFKIKEVSQ